MLRKRNPASPLPQQPLQKGSVPFSVTSTLYDSNKGFFPSDKVTTMLTQSLVGGGVTVVFEHKKTNTQCDGVNTPRPIDADITIGMGKFLGLGWNDAQGETWLGAGFEFGSPIQVAKEMPNNL